MDAAPEPVVKDRTPTSGTGGALSTTVKAGRGGTYRFAFAGTSTTGAKTSAGGHVTVKWPRALPVPRRPRGNDSVASGALSIDAPFVLGLRSSHPNRKLS